MTDDKQVSFGYWTGGGETPSATLQSATTWVRSNLLDPTELSTSLSASVASTTDVVMHDANYVDYCESALGVQWTTDGVYGLRGFTTCTSVTPGGRCQQQHVRLSVRFFDVHGNNGDRWLVCHEVGHAIGLAHRPPYDGCMDNCVDTSALSYTAHDVAHFNAPLTQTASSGTAC
jgi:hypothetical protein